MQALLTTLGPSRLALLGGYGVLSAVSFVAYGVDKGAARRGTWRTPEVLLHVLAAAGGWPGALAGQRVFRHKTRKQPFRAIFWCTVIANCAVAALILGTLPAGTGS